MSNRRADSADAIPSRVRPSRQIAAQVQSLADEHQLRTLSALGEAIKIKAAELRPGFHISPAETALQYIAKGIEVACGDLSLSIPPRLYVEIPTSGTTATTEDWFGSGNRIAGTLATFADRLSTLLVRSFTFDRSNRILVDDNAGAQRIDADPRLRVAWGDFLLDRADTLVDRKVDRFDLNKRQREIKTQLMSAIEVFALAREYGNHLAEHIGRDGAQTRVFAHAGSDLMADEIAWSIGRYLGQRCFAGEFGRHCNTWLESGAAAVAVLVGARVIRCTRDFFETGTHNANSHLDYLTRLSALESWPGFDGDPNKRRLSYQRQLVRRIILDVDDRLRELFAGAYEAGIRYTVAETAPTSTDDDDNGLLEIVTKDVVTENRSMKAEEFFARHTGTTVEGMKTRSLETEHALTAIRSKAGDPIKIADLYLKHLQERDIEQWASALVKKKLGTADRKLESSAARKLGNGRTDGNHLTLQSWINILSLKLESACRELGLPLNEGIMCGVAWNPASATAQKKLSEGASIVLVPESVLMICHFLCKVLAQIIPMRDYGGRYAIDCDFEMMLGNIKNNERLKKYAAGALAFCATWNRNVGKPWPPLTGGQALVWHQLLAATELFIIAHEYSHHIRNHNSPAEASVDGVSSDISKAQELEADHYGSLLTAHIGERERWAFAQNGSAAVIALTSVDIMRRTRDVLATGKEREFFSPTHPTLETRLLKLQDNSSAGAVAAQENVRKVLEGIWRIVLPRLRVMHEYGVRPVPAGNGEGDWLPLFRNSEYG